MSSAKDNYPYTFGDAFFQTLRLALLGLSIRVAIWQTCLQLEPTKVSVKEGQCSGWTITLGVLVGIIVYFVFMNLFYKVVHLFFGLEILTCHDCQFLCDDDFNNNNIVAGAILEQFDYISMKQHILSKVTQLHKCKSILVKRLGLFWMKELSDEEWKLQINKIIKLEENIHTDEELKNLAIRENQIYDMYDMPQYRFYLIPDFQPGKGALILKIHHNMADGMGISTLL